MARHNHDDSFTKLLLPDDGEHKGEDKLEEGCWQDLLKDTFYFEGNDLLAPGDAKNDTYGKMPQESRLRVKALGRMYNAIRLGDLTVNGLAPDSKYHLGEYLVRGGRVRFDLSDLKNQNLQDEFWNYLFPPALNLETRMFSTHSAAGVDADEKPAEDKGFFSNLRNFLYKFLSKKYYPQWQMHLPVGGYGSTIPGTDIQVTDNGKNGTVLVRRDGPMVMFGIEASTFSIFNSKNQRTNASHSFTGAAGKLSPFMALKLDDPVSIQRQKDDGKIPFTHAKKHKYNWACVTITEDILHDLKQPDKQLTIDHLFENHPKFRKYVGDDLIKNAQAYARDWQQATDISTKSSAKSSQSYWKNSAKWGIALAIIGFAISFIPGVAAIGVPMMAIGLKVAIAAPVVGAVGGLIVGAVSALPYTKHAHHKGAKLAIELAPLKLALKKRKAELLNQQEEKASPSDAAIRVTGDLDDSLGVLNSNQKEAEDALRQVSVTIKPAASKSPLVDAVSKDLLPPVEPKSSSDIVFSQQ